MSLDKGPDWTNRDLFIDYAFEEVMFRWDCQSRTVFKRLYGSVESNNPVNVDNVMFNDAIRFGSEITLQEYLDGKPDRKVMLEKAIGIALQAHAGQVDKGGQPYILHPLRLMLRFKQSTEQIVAILHDVVEDTDVTLIDLERYGFSEEVIEAIGCLTKRNAESYSDFIERIAPNSLARRVKIEDIKDNLDLERLTLITRTDLQRVEKYQAALTRLSSS